MGVEIPPLKFAFGLGLLAFGRFLARDEAHFIKAVLTRMLETHEQP